MHAHMTPGIGYALGAMLCFGLADLVYKRGAAAGAQAHNFLMVQSWVFTPLVLAYALASGALRYSPGLWWGAVAGVFVLVGTYNFAHSLKTGSISINAPVFRLSFTVTAALAVLVLGEPLGAYKFAGLALALVAAWLLLGAPSTQDRGRRESRGSLVRVLIATLAVISSLANFVGGADAPPS
jgi:drug/metabolite transporter (DMT)-like permease